ncbi:hypothetical protein [Mangrovimonas xylaniphaga]|uniref:hypothetical protein n=1 Tax=Mangrovimonas xylaniphaga TaxID=1645915 RepID=UPI0006B5E5B6|nr:hypothetical protein [Mangrovimonas xylaniphaga]
MVSQQLPTHLKTSSTQDSFQYWIVLFMSLNPALQALEAHPEYESVMKKIDERFWKNHDELQETLEAKGPL